MPPPEYLANVDVYLLAVARLVLSSKAKTEPVLNCCNTGRLSATISSTTRLRSWSLICLPNCTHAHERHAAPRNCRKNRNFIIGAMCPQPPCPRSPVPAAFARLPRPCRESLLANDNVELLSIAERQGAGPSRDAFFRVRPRDDPDAGLRAGSSRFRLRSLPSPSCILPTTTSSSIGVVAPLAAQGCFADRQLSDTC